MDLREAINGDTEYAVKFKSFTLYFNLRNPSNAEDLEFRRRSGQVKVKNGRLDSSDTALDAPLWLLAKVKTKLEYSNGTPERFEVPDDLYAQIPNRTKLSVIARYLQDIEGEEAEAAKN